MKEERNKRRLLNVLIFAFIGFFIISLFIVAICLGYAPDYLTKIVCKEQPYEDTEYYDIEEPYETTEIYYEKEPYTDTERYCSDRSWWSGNCVSWSYRTITKYMDVKKHRIIIKYRTRTKSRTITKHETVCVRIYFWKSVDYSENWLNYPELYDRQGIKIK